MKPDLPPKMVISKYRNVESMDTDMLEEQNKQKTPKPAEVKIESKETKAKTDVQGKIIT